MTFWEEIGEKKGILKIFEITNSRYNKHFFVSLQGSLYREVSVVLLTSEHNARINKYPVDKYKGIFGGKDRLFIFYTE